MPKVKLLKPKSIVTKWNGEDKPRVGNVGDTAFMKSVPDYLSGYVEIVNEPAREFVVNPADAPKRKRRTKSAQQEGDE